MTPYLERFQDAADVAAYDEAEYRSDSYSSFIWELQKPVLREIIERQRVLSGEIRLLDFACGTGRIISFVENLVAASDGVDLSPAMLSRAAERCRKSDLFAGDIVEDSSLANHRYDVITAFRFLLNVEGPIQRAALRALRSRIAENGILILNMHGNAFSLRHFAIAFRRWREARRHKAGAKEIMLAEMTKHEVTQLLRGAGFEVKEIVGFGIVPRFFYRTPLVSMAKWIDRALVAKSFCRSIAIDLMFICTPSKS